MASRPPTGHNEGVESGGGAVLRWRGREAERELTLVSQVYTKNDQVPTASVIYSPCGAQGIL